MGIIDLLFKNKKKDGKDQKENLGPILPQEIYAASALELSDIIAPSALKINPKELNLGNRLVRSYFVISYPRFLTESWFSPIINLDKIFDISIFIHPVDTSRVLKQFQKKVAEVQSQIHSREAKGMVRDPMLDTAYQDLENLRDSLQQAQEKLFDVGLYLSLYAENEEELDKIESEIKSILEAQLVYVKPALFQQEQGFRSAIPISTDLLSVHSKLNSSPLSSIFPFVSFDLTSDKGILFGINRHNSGLVLFDRFSLENYNSVTLAKSGSGKSILGHEPTLFRKNGKVYLRPIGETVENLIEERGAVAIDHEMEGVVDPGIEVWSFDKDMKGSWSQVSVAARKEAPQKFYRFKTKSGRIIETTADHNMLVLRNGEVVAAKSDNVKIGEYIPLPRKIESDAAAPNTLPLLEILRNCRVYVKGASEIIKQNYKFLSKKTIDVRYDRYLYKYRDGRRVPLGYFLKILKNLSLSPCDPSFSTLSIVAAKGKSCLPAMLPISQNLAKTFGYLVSEGTISEKYAIISNIDQEVIRDICMAFREIGVCHFTTPKSVNIVEPPFVALLGVLGLKHKSAGKRVPSVILQGNSKIKAAFLSAYFEGDGGVDGQAITAVSKSKALISDLSYLLYFFGIITRISVCKKQIPGKEKTDYYHLSISDQNNLRRFQEQIGFITRRKKESLAKITVKNGNTNTDIVPGLKPLTEELYKLFGSQLSNLSEFSALKQGHDFSPSRLGRLAEEIEKRIEKFRNLEPFIRKLADLPTIEAIIKKAEEDRQLNRKLIETMSGSWFTIKQGMAPRTINALKALAVAEETAPTSVQELKEMISFGILGTGLFAKDIDKNLSISLRGYRNNSSYETLRSAADFIVGEYNRVLGILGRVEKIIKTFKTLSTADLFWDPIVTIENKPNEKEKYVYDLEVANEVFLAGYGGMFVHNSYFTKLEILRTLMFDADVMVIDPEREYEYMADAIGGRYFKISLTSEHHINPFDLPPIGEGESAADILRSNIINLVGLFRIMFGGISPEEDAIIDRAITETYALKDITPESNFENIEAPLMSDFELVLSGMEGAESLVQRLSKYTKGTWAGFINKPTNVDINKKFVVFSLRDMEDELKPVAMYIVTHHIWSAIRRELKKRLLVIDEAWWMMKSEDTASFLLSLAKRGRKYYLGLATITQDVDDFLKSPYGLPIITNSSIQVLLKQSPTTIDKLQKTFNLTEEEKYLLLESGVGEGIFFAGLKHVAIKIIASYTEDQIITSDPSQLLAIKKAKQEIEKGDSK